AAAGPAARRPGGGGGAPPPPPRPGPRKSYPPKIAAEAHILVDRESLCRDQSESEDGRVRPRQG
ncbi:hypothetical protein ABIB28_003052, partial [Sphingomonas sp. UYEF23]